MRLLISLFVLALSSACVKPPDVPICRDLIEKQLITKDAFGIEDRIFQPNPLCEEKIKEPRCGYCTWSISDKNQYVGENQKTWLYKKPWSQIRYEAIIMPTESYAEIKQYIMDICKKDDNCQKDIAKWRMKFGSIEIK